MLGLVVAEAEQVRRDGDHGRHGPDDHDDGEYALACPLHAVLDVGDGPVAVERNRHQVEYARGAREDVEARPYVAQYFAERPAVGDLLVGAERHDHDRDGEIGKGERHDQVVGHAVQVALEYDGGDHKRVADHRANDEQAEYDREQHALEHGALAVDHGRVVERMAKASPAAAARWRLHCFACRHVGHLAHDQHLVGVHVPRQVCGRGDGRLAIPQIHGVVVVANAGVGGGVNTVLIEDVLVIGHGQRRRWRWRRC